MFKLEKRKAVREHMARVNAGEIKDPIVTSGTDDNGNVIGDDGTPVPGTAPKGYSPKGTDTDTDTGGGTGAIDYTKLRSHADLDGALADMKLENTPEGWATLNVADKQAKLAEINTATPPAGGWA